VYGFGHDLIPQGFQQIFGFFNIAALAEFITARQQ